jgi:hypothetical protein
MGNAMESAAKHWKKPEPAGRSLKTGSAHWLLSESGALGIVDGNGAGFPEQSAPEHGIGSLSGISLEGRAPDRMSSSKCVSGLFKDDEPLA